MELKGVARGRVLGHCRDHGAIMQSQASAQQAGLMMHALVYSTNTYEILNTTPHVKVIQVRT